jgi:hypothetical protein
MELVEVVCLSSGANLSTRLKWGSRINEIFIVTVFPDYIRKYCFGFPVSPCRKGAMKEFLLCVLSGSLLHHIGENGVILDKIFIFQLFLFVFIFYEIFFTYIVKYPLVYLLYFLFFFPFENKGVVTIFTKSIFCTFVKKRGVKLDRRCLRLDSAN